MHASVAIIFLQFYNGEGACAPSPDPTLSNFFL